MPIGIKSQRKVRFTFTLDPQLVIEARKLTSNLSGFMEEAGWREIKRHRHYIATQLKNETGK